VIGYLLRRFLLAVSMVWAVSFGAFVIFGLAFDPTWQYNLCLPGCGEQRAKIIAAYHLHAPILYRYWLWLTGLFVHGFGTAPSSASAGNLGVSIGPALWPAARITAELLASALVLTTLLSVFVGVLAAWLSGSALDWTLRLLTYVLWSMPAFLVGALLLRGLGGVHWFNFGHVDGGIGGWLRWMFLPALTLSLALVGLHSRYIRSGMITELGQPYAVVARAKGLRERRVLLRHALPNTLAPVISLLALELSAVVGAALAIEYVYDMPGLARYFFGSLNAADPFVLTAILVVIATVVATANFLADIAIGWLDPRVRIAAPR
jgi:peptide/nickel transport system permease protein